MNNPFYAYIWFREDGTPYYVGKTRYLRRTYGEKHSVHPPADRTRITVLRYETEQEALGCEVELIAFWGRKDLGTGCLRNLTDGGDGVCGYVYTEEYRQNMRRIKTGFKHSPEACRKIGDAHRGLVMTPETRLRMSASRKGKPAWNKGRAMSDKQRQAISRTQTGKRHSVETRRKMSESQTQRAFIPTEQHRATLSASCILRFKGKPWSEARRAAQQRRA